MDHIEPFLPFVSDLGVKPPEASLFSVFMNCGSILILTFVLIRHESTKSYIENINSTYNKSMIQRLNRRSLISGLLMVTGFLGVANFRNSEGIFIQTTHNISAVLGFGSAVFDIYLQSKIAFELGRKNTARIRCVLSGTCFILALVYNLLAFYSFSLLPEALFDTDRRLKWNNSEVGYTFHVVGTILEWVLIFLLSPYFATFISEFNKFKFSKQIIVYKDINENMNFRSLDRVV